jgi:class 3 adenylate cyclase
VALLRKNLRQPDEVRRFTNGRIEVFELGDTAVGRAVYEPGWRWLNDVQPLVGTTSCMVLHQGLVVSGRLRVAMADGPEMDVGPGDLFEIPPGHDAWVLGDEPWVSVDFTGRRDFGRSAPAAGTRVVATILFTDIVDSTPTLARLGDAAWKELLAEHNQRARAAIDRFRGREVATTGDGLLVVFDSAAGALRCAAAIIRAAAELGVDVRAGVHSGEVERAGAEVRGIAVHAAARIMALAGAAEILTSRTTRDLADGSGLTFAPHGRHTLKGLVEPFELFALVQEPTRI